MIDIETYIEQDREDGSQLVESLKHYPKAFPAYELWCAKHGRQKESRTSINKFLVAFGFILDKGGPDTFIMKQQFLGRPFSILKVKGGHSDAVFMAFDLIDQVNGEAEWDLTVSDESGAFGFGVDFEAIPSDRMTVSIDDIPTSGLDLHINLDDLQGSLDVLEMWVKEIKGRLK